MRRNLLENLTGSQFGRVVFIGVIVLLLEIPAAMVHDVIRERSRYQESAGRETSALWGGSQTFQGPRIVARYRCDPPYQIGGQPTRGGVFRDVVFLPDELVVNASTTTEVLSRGIYEFPVYRAQLAVSGKISLPDVTVLGLDAERVELVDLALVLELPDRRSLQRISTVSWQNEQLEFKPTLAADGSTGGLRAPLALPAADEPAAFAFDVELNGSKSLFFLPLGRATSVSLTSDWSSPSFSGAWLPTERNVHDAGFTASWQVPYLGRTIPIAWFAEHPPEAELQTIAFGTAFIPGVDAYRMAERSVKYSTLFVVLTFAALWLVDVLTKVAIHPLQYLLVGAALSLFYLLELSLAEHIGFGPAYTLAAITIVGTILLYCVPVLRGRLRTAAMAVLLASLYGYLYVVLRNQDHALLAGTTLLFAALATVMFLTRNIDWFALTARRDDDTAQA
ncbi:MAG: cell envelope integrity protein CreD [Gammaproteobacteria bacterium]|nr:cell envelope integrity protein CreD [Gammaproteobacteria bacterium]